MLCFKLPTFDSVSVELSETAVKPLITVKSIGSVEMEQVRTPEGQRRAANFYGSATNHLELGIWVGCWVSMQISTQALCINNQAYNCLIHL